MLSNAYFLAKLRFDTAENEPAKKLQGLSKFANIPIFAARGRSRDLRGRSAESKRRQQARDLRLEIPAGD